MMSNSLIYKVTRAYYEKGLTQQAIANRYGISRIKVSRLLARAQKEQIVQIKIIAPDDPFTDLEHELEEKFGLDEVMVVEKLNESNQDWINRAGMVAADYINSIIQGNETIGLTWGRSLLSLVNNLHLQNYPELKVVQMLGGLGEPQAEFHGADLTRRMAQNFGTRPYLIQSPGIVKNKEICDELKHDIQVRDTLHMATQASIAIVGIGLFAENSQITRTNTIINKNDYQVLKDKGVVGDISLRFFNGNGEYVKTHLDDRIVGISTEEILKIPRIIGIAGGEEKFSTLKAVATGKLVHALITDNITAEKLIKQNN